MHKTATFSLQLIFKMFIAVERFIAVVVVTVLLVGPSAAAAAAYDPALIVANIDTGKPML
jgi:hypothetical protein